MSSRSGKKNFVSTDKRLSAEEAHPILLKLLAVSGNEACADCDSRGPTWASVSIGMFICIHCSGHHRNLGVHLSVVRSTSLDSWKMSWLETMRDRGNAEINSFYEYNVPTGVKPVPGAASERYIRDKYERNLFTKRNNPKKSKHKHSSKTKNGSESTEDRKAKKNKSRKSKKASKIEAHLSASKSKSLEEAFGGFALMDSEEGTNSELSKDAANSPTTTDNSEGAGSDVTFLSTSEPGAPESVSSPVVSGLGDSQPTSNNQKPSVDDLLDFNTFFQAAPSKPVVGESKDSNVDLLDFDILKPEERREENVDFLDTRNDKSSILSLFSQTLEPTHQAANFHSSVAGALPNESSEPESNYVSEPTDLLTSNPTEEQHTGQRDYFEDIYGHRAAYNAPPALGREVYK